MIHTRGAAAIHENWRCLIQDRDPVDRGPVASDPSQRSYQAATWPLNRSFDAGPSMIGMQKSAQVGSLIFLKIKKPKDGEEGGSVGLETIAGN